MKRLQATAAVSVLLIAGGVLPSQAAHAEDSSAIAVERADCTGITVEYADAGPDAVLKASVTV